MDTLEIALEELLEASYTTEEIRITIEEITKGINNSTENEADDK